MNMLQFRFFSTIFMLSISTLSQANVTELERQQIQKRIQPVGSVYLSSEVSVPQKQGPLSSDVIYARFCSACHATGVLSAPIYGNKNSWQPHLAKGKDTLKKHLINGFNNMPARGNCLSCSDEELYSVLDYVLESVK